MKFKTITSDTMKTLKIKCLFPENAYLVRNVKIIKANGEKFKVKPFEVLDLEITEDEELTIRIDQHKAKVAIKMDDIDDVGYLLVTLNYVNSRTFTKNSLLFRNLMVARVVDQKTFEDFYYDSIEPKVVKTLKIVDYAGIGLGMAFFLAVLAGTILDVGYPPDERDFLFFISIGGVVALARFLFFKDSRTVKAYNLSMKGSFFIALVVIFYSFDLGSGVVLTEILKGLTIVWFLVAVGSISSKEN